MIRKVKTQHSKRQILDLLEPLIQKWFDSSFEDLTEPQSYAVPLIHNRMNVLVSSPTGSGKTMTAFLSVINELLKLQKKGKLENKIYCVYISPLKALANDINRNLTTPLQEMTELALREGLEPPQIRVAVRSGDTSASERQKMARKPPHIFITTPESLSLVLTAPKFRKKLSDAQWVIVDEIHEVCSSKRGVHLSLSLERLREQIGRNFVRIGLSATIAPINEIAKFLAGYENGRLRDMNVVEVESTKKLDLRVLCPVQDMTILPYEIVNARMYDLLKQLAHFHQHQERHRACFLQTERERHRGPGSPSWEPQQVHKTGRGGEAEERGAQGGCLIHLSRTGHRYRLHRPGLSDRITKVNRQGSAENRKVRPRSGRHQHRENDSLRQRRPR
jgi:ATP-dependent Lhr-like helicase